MISVASTSARPELRKTELNKPQVHDDSPIPFDSPSSTDSSDFAIPILINSSPDQQTKRKLSFSPKSKMRAGNRNAMHFRRWTKEMKSEIDQLLALHVESEDKYERIVQSYTKKVHESLSNVGKNTRLFPTYSRFIQLYENDLNRQLDSAEAISSSSIDISALHDSLHETIFVKSTAVTEGARPVVKEEPDISKTCHPDVISLVENIPMEQSVEEPPKKQSRKREPKSEKSGTNAGRNCLTCGKPKAKGSGDNNLHQTYVKKGEPCIFYCPQLMHDLYGSPVDMTFPDFKASQYWALAVEDAIKKKMVADEKKKKAAALREEKGWKKSGPDSKKPM